MAPPETGEYLGEIVSSREPESGPNKQQFRVMDFR